MIEVTEEIKLLTNDLARRSFQNARFFPVDREFLRGYLSEVLRVDNRAFIFYNLDQGNANYTVQLFLCLPEIWENVSVNDLLEIIPLLTKLSSFFTIIEFTYKYVEIDILQLIFRSDALGKDTKSELAKWLKNQYHVLLKSKGDYSIIQHALSDLDYNIWSYIKQKIILDDRVQPALTSVEELNRYSTNLYKKYSRE